MAIDDLGQGGRDPHRIGQRLRRRLEPHEAGGEGFGFGGVGDGGHGVIACLELLESIGRVPLPL